MIHKHQVKLKEKNVMLLVIIFFTCVQKRLSMWCGIKQINNFIDVIENPDIGQGEAYLSLMRLNKHASLLNLNWSYLCACMIHFNKKLFI